MRRLLPIAALLLGGAAPVPDLGARLERFAYPFPIEHLRLTIADAPAEMTFMDVRPERPNG